MLIGYDRSLHLPYDVPANEYLNVEGRKLSKSRRWVITMGDALDRYDADLIAHVRKDHQKLDFLGFDRRSVAVSARYDWLRRIVEASTDRVPVGKASAGERLDRVLTHRVGGPAVFLVTMALMFNAVFVWAHAPMDLITSGFDLIGRGLPATLPPGDLRNVLVNGALAGVANVVAFLPQIMLLFFFLGLLEGSGFRARAAYVMDRIMGRVGLHGKFNLLAVTGNHLSK